LQDFVSGFVGMKIINLFELVQINPKDAQRFVLAGLTGQSREFERENGPCRNLEKGIERGLRQLRRF
jgi:hypothetical protein